jgi:hypothetical protein
MPRLAAGITIFFPGLSLGLRETRCGYVPHAAKINRHLPSELKRCIERSVDPELSPSKFSEIDQPGMSHRGMNPARDIRGCQPPLETQQFCPCSKLRGIFDLTTSSIRPGHPNNPDERSNYHC